MNHTRPGIPKNSLLVAGGLILIGGITAWVSQARMSQENALPQAPPENPSAIATIPIYEPPDESGFVGSFVCAECHRDIAETYKSHPMSRSIEVMTSETPSHLPSGERANVGSPVRRYEVEHSDGQMRHHERMFDKSGAEIYDQSVTMHFVVGSGSRAKAYLHQRDHLLFMSPLNWYSTAQKWDLAPGYEVDDPRRFDRRVTDQCLSCHAGRVHALGRSLNRYANPVFREPSVGCENCHGPGAEHVAFHRSGGSAHAADPIVNPARLEASLRDSVCYQCHLHGEARILRYGRSDFDFRPGKPFDDVWTILVSDGGSENGGQPHAVSQVQQMRASRCYQASEGRMGCISCHDPHGLPSEKERVEFYQSKCLSCHQDQECGLPIPERAKEQNSCIACHMPAETTSNIAHVAQTDHRVMKRPLPSGTKVPQAMATADGLTFFDGTQKRLEPWEQDRAIGLGSAMYLAKTDRPLPPSLIQKLDDVLKTVPKDGAILTALGAKALDHGKLDLAQSYFETALKLPDAEESARWGLLKAHYLSRRWREALGHADWLIALDPGDYRAQALRADILVQLGQLSDGIKAAEESLRFNPTLLDVRVLLFSLYQQSLQFEKAKEQERIIQQMKEVRP